MLAKGNGWARRRFIRLHGRLLRGNWPGGGGFRRSEPCSRRAGAKLDDVALVGRGALVDDSRGFRLRVGRSSDAGRIYLVTVCCSDRSLIFDRIDRWRCFARSLSAISDDAYTWCYVTMPDHVHWLLQLTERQGLSRCVQKIKSMTTKNLRRQGFRGERVWQRGFHDRALRREEDLRDVARYVIANPVRAGLVESVRDYPFWDAAWI